jgi:hypothetical protein
MSLNSQGLIAELYITLINYLLQILDIYISMCLEKC